MFSINTFLFYTLTPIIIVLCFAICCINIHSLLTSLKTTNKYFWFSTEKRLSKRLSQLRNSIQHSWVLLELELTNYANYKTLSRYVMTKQYDKLSVEICSILSRIENETAIYKLMAMHYEQVTKKSVPACDTVIAKNVQNRLWQYANLDH